MVVLNSDQQEFLRGYSSRRFYSRMERFWGYQIDSHHSLVLPNGEVVDITLRDISFKDYGYYPAIHCLCGQGIRYEFKVRYNQEFVGPIGSTCIQTFTGLSGQVVKDILKGSGEVSREIREVSTILEQYGSFEKWASIFGLEEKRELLPLVPEACGFIDHNLPLPSRLAIEVARQRFSQTKSRIPSEPPIVQQARALLPRSEIANLPLGRTIASLLGRGGKLNDAQINLLEKIVARCRDEDQFVALEAIEFLYKAVHHDSFVYSLYTSGIKYGLSNKQIDCILGRKNSISLIERYKGVIESQQDELPWYTTYLTSKEK